MNPEPVPSAIVARLVQAAKELEEWADTHRPSSLAVHEHGVLKFSDAAWGRLWAACWNVPWSSISNRLDVCARRVSGTRRRPHQWRVRSPMSQCGQTPFERPTFWCRPCRRGWAPADAVLGLAAHQVVSIGVHAWVAETAAEVPFHQAAERLERLTGIGLGTETPSDHDRVPVLL